VRTDRAGQSALLLLDAVEILDRERIPYVVIGAFALSALGVVRASRDADALLQVSHARLIKLRALFEASGFETTIRRGDREDPIPGMLIVRDSYGNQVDLLEGLRGLDPDTFSRSLKVAFLKHEICIASREDFIAMKCFAGGPQDVLDARAAYDTAPGPVNIDLLRALTRRFGREASDHLERVLA
jgi:hypothetical protein